MTAASPPMPSFALRLARETVLHPAAQTAAVLWIGATVAVILLAQGMLPFDRPALAAMSFAQQVALPTAGLIEVGILMAVVYALTRKRAVPDMAARAPARQRAAIETASLLAYAMMGQAGGWIVGPSLGYRPFSFHLAGTLVGCSTPPAIGEVWTWAIYNFVVFAAVPYAWFRARYSAERLNLCSGNRRNDLLVIAVVAVLEGAAELAAFPGLFSMTPHALVRAAPLAFFVFFIGTVLPTMVLIYAILVPRYLRLTGSFTTTVLLGGLTYAAMHLVEGWTRYRGPRDSALSLILVLLTYAGPGMFKTFVTLRTGNAWVHAVGYHAIAPHMLVDTPLIASTFTIR